jgi:hypothetical protein
MQNIAEYRQALATRNARAMQLAQMQADERESTIAYSFERSHNRALLDTKLRLQMPHLSKRTRAALARQLATLQAEQAAAVSAQRSADAQTLAELRASLDAQTQQALQHAQADVRTSAGVKLNTPQQSGPNLTASIASTDTVSADLAGRLNELRGIHQTNVASLDSEIAALRDECARLSAEINRSSRGRGAASTSSPAR